MFKLAKLSETFWVDPSTITLMLYESAPAPHLHLRIQGENEINLSGDEAARVYAALSASAPATDGGTE